MKGRSMTTDLYRAQRLAEERGWWVDGPVPDSYLTLANGEDLAPGNRVKLTKKNNTSASPLDIAVIRALFDDRGALIAANGKDSTERPDLQAGGTDVYDMSSVEIWMW
jgi:hypothetical protein